MSGERQVLSSEEVDAILKVTQDQDGNAQTMGADGNPEDPNAKANAALASMAETTRLEFEKVLTQFLRKKIKLSIKAFAIKTLGAALKEAGDKCVFAVFHITPSDHYGMLVMDLALLHQLMNLLYGADINTKEEPLVMAGKVGMLIADKIHQLALMSLTQAVHERLVINTEIIKASGLPHTTTHLTLEESMYAMDINIILDDFEGTLRLIMAEAFIEKTIVGTRRSEVKHKEKDFWRTAIKSQVVDSFVSVNVTLPDVQMKVHEFMALKEGDLLPIGDPTLVYVSLNNLKLFRARAGQANAKRVAKIITQI